MGIRLVRGGVCGVDVDEELFCVPVEERREVGVEVEADLGVFFAFGGVVVWSAFDAVLGKWELASAVAAFQSGSFEFRGVACSFN